MNIRAATAADAGSWLRMREALWPAGPGEVSDHPIEVAAYFRDDLANPAEVLLAFAGDGVAVGFAELSIRREAESCYSGRVAYLEGWWVDESHRRQGIGHALVRAAEEWGRAQGCSEMASDAELGNLVSQAAHRGSGFVETNRVVNYRKAL